MLKRSDLWDNIASDESAVPFPQSHRKELDRRLKRYESAPGTLLSLEELQTRIEKRKRLTLCVFFPKSRKISLAVMCMFGVE